MCECWGLGVCGGSGGGGGVCECVCVCVCVCFQKTLKNFNYPTRVNFVALCVCVCTWYRNVAGKV